MTKSRKTKHNYNVPPQEIKVLRQTKIDKQWTVTDTDKGLGPAIIETQKLYKTAHAEHLSNPKNYKEITKEHAETLNLSTFHRICKLMIDQPHDEISHKFFVHKLIGDKPNRDQFGKVLPLPSLQLPYFYVLPKVHKTPWKTRPVVSSVSTALEPLSQWIDDQLQQVLHLCPAYLKDSWHLLRKLKDIKQLPHDARLFTADAVSMYSNIPTKHGLEVMKKWFDLHRNHLPKDYPVKRILEGLTIVMNFNVFTYGNRYFQQLNGTAMGTPCACAYATIYYSYHEETQLVHTYQSPKPIMYVRLIDDALVIMRHTQDNCQKFITKMNQFKDSTNNGLEWEAESPSKQVNFLDLTLHTNAHNVIETKTYQKAMNLYLYRPPTSNQPQAMLKGMIYSTLHRYLWQNAQPQDFLRFTIKLLCDLERRGHSTDKLLKMFQQTIVKLQKSKMPQQKIKKQHKKSNNCFLHVTFHRQNPSSKIIQQAFQEHCVPAFEKHHLNIKRLIIAQHGSASISQMVKVNRLPETENTTLAMGEC